MPISKPSLISIVDDNGNPLFKRSSDNFITDGGLQKGKPDLGFTPPEDFLTSNDPSELGNLPNVTFGGITTQKRNEINKEYENGFPQSDGILTFKHNLDDDRRIPESTIESSTIYLGSFVSTKGENEDPTMLGYDLMIDLPTSPLFNGGVEDFINSNIVSGTAEIASRKATIAEFKSQFFKFFKTNSPVSSQSSDGGDASAAPLTRVHYLKKIEGLDRLVESNLSNDASKSFVNYGTDFIKLSLNEDVTQNIGYLASLYKNLAWSRINGKQVIPENLLRFNLILTITEVRRYNRVALINQDYKVLADLISKYEYNLYECQFFFPKLPHGDALDLSNPTLVDSLDIQFNYKFSTMKFVKFEFNGSTSSTTKQMDNQFVDIYQKTPMNSNLGSVGSSIVLTNANTRYRELGRIEEGGTIQTSMTTQNSLTQPAQQKSQFRENLERLGGDLRRAAVNEVNRRVVTQFRLLNRTLDNIRNSIPLAGRMGPPTNVYTQDQLSLATDVQNAIRNFAGRSIRSLFGGSR